MSDACPKCGASKSGASCPKCGLIFEKFSPAVLEAGARDEIRALWNAVEADWDDASKHAVFVERALIDGAGAYAVSCYRTKGDDPVAVKYRGRISRRLEQMLLETPKTEPRDRGKARLLGVVLMAIILTGLTLLFWYTSN